jgi:hypothetical protein
MINCAAEPNDGMWYIFQCFDPPRLTSVHHDTTLHHTFHRPSYLPVRMGVKSRRRLFGFHILQQLELLWQIRQPHIG